MGWPRPMTCALREWAKRSHRACLDPRRDRLDWLPWAALPWLRAAATCARMRRARLGIPTRRWAGLAPRCRPGRDGRGTPRGQHHVALFRARRRRHAGHERRCAAGCSHHAVHQLAGVVRRTPGALPIRGLSRRDAAHRCTDLRIQSRTDSALERVRVQGSIQRATARQGGRGG
jgi:hypothetical protein